MRLQDSRIGPQGPFAPTRSIRLGHADGSASSTW